jgi:hypothetical protein
MSLADRHPYKASTASAANRAARRPLRDADVLIPLLVLSPAFLAVVVRTMARGEEFGAGPTVCAAIVLLAVAMFVSAWRDRSTDRSS